MATVAVVPNTTAYGAQYDDGSIRLVVFWSIDDEGLVTGYVIMDEGEPVPAHATPGFVNYGGWVQPTGGLSDAT